MAQSRQSVRWRNGWALYLVKVFCRHQGGRSRRWMILPKGGVCRFCFFSFVVLETAIVAIPATFDAVPPSSVAGIAGMA